jgi:hypothetical protein
MNQLDGQPRARFPEIPVRLGFPPWHYACDAEVIEREVCMRVLVIGLVIAIMLLVTSFVSGMERMW